MKFRVHLKGSMKVNHTILEDFYLAYNQHINDYYTQSITEINNDVLDAHYIGMMDFIALKYGLSFEDICRYESLAKSLWEERNGAI